MKHVISLIATLTLLVAVGCTTAERPAFEPALQRHLDSITNRDIETYIELLTQRDDFTIVFPNGYRTTTRDDAIEFHREWFADPNWRMTFDEVTRIESEDTATVMFRTSYRDSEEGTPRDSWLTLYFQLEEGSWLLVHDQNTRIEDAD